MQSYSNASRSGRRFARGLVSVISVGALLVCAAAAYAAPEDAPANNSPPTISGTAEDGQTLTADRGSWSGTEPITYAYQWRRCDSAGGGCVEITGATGTSYTLTGDDVGSTMRVRVTASNSVGLASASSEPTGEVVAPQDAPCTILGTDGADVIHGTSGDDVICGLGGDDQLYGEGGHDVLRGGAGRDRLYGGVARDELVGGDGDDRLKGGSGADVFRGNAGWDHVVYWGQWKPVTISIGDGPNDGTAGEDDDVLADIEFLSGGKGDDTLIAARQHHGFANTLWGHGGNDRLVGGDGVEIMWGGDGDDSFDSRGDTFQDWRGRDFLNCGNGFDSVLSDTNDSPRLPECENVL